MASVRRRGAGVRVTFTTAEVELLVWLVGQVLELLELDRPANAAASSAEDPLESLEQLIDGPREPVEAPTDPVLRRLLPDAYRDDGTAAQEFRRLTDADLRATKRDALLGIVTDVSQALEQAEGSDKVRLELDDASVAGWLPALTDVRLALGTRIGVSEDTDAERVGLDPGSRRHAELATYDWLAWLQEALVRALTRG